MDWVHCVTAGIALVLGRALAVDGIRGIGSVYCLANAADHADARHNRAGDPVDQSPL